MNRPAWTLHLENVALRRKVDRLHSELERQRRIADLWRQRAMHGRQPGRATRKAT